jgi:hypothetical protein
MRSGWYDLIGSADVYCPSSFVTWPRMRPSPAACGAFHFTAPMMASKPHRPFEILWRLLQQGGQPPDEFKDMLFMLIYLAALLALFWLMSEVAHVPLRK